MKNEWARSKVTQSKFDEQIKRGKNWYHISIMRKRRVIYAFKWKIHTHFACWFDNNHVDGDDDDDGDYKVWFWYTSPIQGCNVNTHQWKQEIRKIKKNCQNCFSLMSRCLVEQNFVLPHKTVRKQHLVLWLVGNLKNSLQP